jgi:hypothetical protein
MYEINGSFYIWPNLEMVSQYSKEFRLSDGRHERAMV